VHEVLIVGFEQRLRIREAELLAEYVLGPRDVDERVAVAVLRCRSASGERRASPEHAADGRFRLEDHEVEAAAHERAEITSASIFDSPPRPLTEPVRERLGGASSSVYWQGLVHRPAGS
jgi:hypothetical protein